MNSLIDKIIDCIPSKPIRSYLRKNEDNLTIMQLATLIDNYCKKDYVENMKSLMNFSKSDFERGLLEAAVKDYKKYKSIDESTCDYYKKNDPRDIKPLCPFQEYIELPRLLNDYDLGTLPNGEIVVIGKIGEITNLNIEFGDLSYMAYKLDNNDALSKETLFKIHCHIHYCEISKINKAELNKKQRNRYDDLFAHLKENGY